MLNFHLVPFSDLPFSALLPRPPHSLLLPYKSSKIFIMAVCKALFTSSSPRTSKPLSDVPLVCKPHGTPDISRFLMAYETLLMKGHWYMKQPHVLL